VKFFRREVRKSPGAFRGEYTLRFASEGHAAGEAPDYRNTRAANDGFPVANRRIDNDAVLSLQGDSNITGFAQLVENSVSFGAIPPVPNWT
jgi:hypothetical protein